MNNLDMMLLNSCCCLGCLDRVIGRLGLYLDRNLISKRDKHYYGCISYSFGCIGLKSKFYWSLGYTFHGRLNKLWRFRIKRSP